MKIHIIGGPGTGKTYLAKSWQKNLEYHTMIWMIYNGIIRRMHTV